MKKSVFTKKKNKTTFFNNTWEAVSLIGEGSFGKVYKAKKIGTKIEDFCAIKNIKIPQNSAEVANLKSEGLSDAEVREEIYQIVKKCLNEIELMQSLKESSNIVTIDDYEVIETKNKIEWNINIRMELLTPVDEYYKENDITNKDVLKLGIDICDALNDCKKLKIIHRDIKPDNIFISKFGSYKLGDFGIARNLERTTSGLSKKGTYNYMAPEVYKSDAYNSSVDMYSLGIVLYRFFNYNRIPFLPVYPTKIKLEDRENSIIKRMRGDKIENPFNATLEESKIILKSLNYDVKKRYQNPQEMGSALRKLYDKEKIRNLPKLNEKLIDKEEIKENDSNKTVSINNIDNLEDNNEKTQSIYDNDIKEEKISDDQYEKTESIYQNTKKDEEKEIDPFDRTESIYESDLNDNHIENIKKEIREEHQEEVKDKDLVLKTNKNKKKKIAIVTSVLVVFLIALLLIINSFKPKEQYVQVKDYIGLTSKEAVKDLKKLNLAEELIYEEVDDESKYGIVIKQNVKNKKVKEKSVIKLTVGVSKEKIEVPDLSNKTLTEATSELEKLGLTISYEEMESDVVEKGKIISQMIKKGTKVNKGSNVEVLVSSGKKEEENKNDKDTNTSESSNSNNNNSNANNNSNNDTNTSSSNNSQNNNSNNNSSQTPPAPEKPAVVTPIIKISGRDFFRPGRVDRLTATVSPADYSYSGITWTSSDPSVAVVNQNGVVTAVSRYGRAVITATITGTSYSTKHSVYVVSIKGDLSGDGVVNGIDASIVYDLLGHGEGACEDAIAVGDVDGDGVLTENDAEMIKDYYNKGGW